jgi:hypothetical protein
VRKAAPRACGTGLCVRGTPSPHPMCQPQPAAALCVAVLPQAERHPLPAPARPLQHDPLQYHTHAASTTRRSTWPGMVTAVRHAAFLDRPRAAAYHAIELSKLIGSRNRNEGR